MKKLLLLIIVLAVGCEQSPALTDINCEYLGAIVYSKSDYTGRADGHILHIKHRGKIFWVKTYEIDNNYKVGDTIKNPCRTTITPKQ